MSMIQNITVVRFSANIATFLFGIAILIQLLLAASVLPVTIAWGGRREVLTPGLRVASIVSAAILALSAYVIRRRAGIVGAEGISAWIKVVAWIVTAYMVFNTFTNIASQCMVEKIVFIPISSMLAITCLIISKFRQ
jgi:hypothetical protein